MCFNRSVGPGLASGCSIDGAAGKKEITKIVFGCLFLHVTEDPFALLDEAWSLGVATFDCAAIYGQGECERILGAWLEARGCAERAVVVTKGGCGDQASLWAPLLSEDGIREEIAGSLQRLRVRCIDLYMLHRDDAGIPVATIVDMMARFVAQGVIASWAVSNWGIGRIAEAMEYAESRGLPGPNSSSIQVSLARPSHSVWPGTEYMREADVEFYSRTALPVFAWECLAKGFLTGKWDVPAMLAAEPPAANKFNDEWRSWTLKKAYLTPENIAKEARVRELAEELGVSPAAVAIAWLFSQVCCLSV